jgi:hypothetical protein
MKGTLQKKVIFWSHVKRKKEVFGYDKLREKE